MKQKDYVYTRTVIYLLSICLNMGWEEVKIPELEQLAKEIKMLGISQKYVEDYIRQRYVERKAKISIGARNFKVVVMEV